MLFRVLPFRIICPVFRIPDLLFRVPYVAIPVFRILLQPIYMTECNWVCAMLIKEFKLSKMENFFMLVI